MHLLDIYQIKLSGGDPARVQMTFERAVTVSAAEPNANLWLQYGSWLDSKLKIPSVGDPLFIFV